MKNTRHHKKTRKLFNRELMGDFEKRLAAYGLTAAVVLAGPQPAKAVEVVWDIPDITFSSGVEYVRFNLISGSTSLIPGTGTGFSTIGNFAINFYPGYLFPFMYGPAFESVAAFVGTGVSYAAVLNHSSYVGPARNFVANSAYPSYGNFCYLSNFHDTTGWFVGLKFDITGNTHYGWAQVDVGAGGSYVSLNAFGYNDAAGAASHIPEPSSLGLLALGAAGLARRRRKKTHV
ncbi:MAG: PEP-CTERM sorting domain-containing protein [Planctomycetota bacterium]|jgi:hypothetical protein